MIFLLSGEGPTDLGVCVHSAEECCGENFLPGPMAMIIDQIVEAKCGYSPLEVGVCRFVPKSSLVERGDKLKVRPLLPGKKRGKETGYFFKNARALASLAVELQQEMNDDVVAVLFRDSDGTVSAGRGLWKEKLQSMIEGFKFDGFDRGVPMLPKPKSEAWVLCALKKNYRSCASLEDRPGNDASPKSLKQELKKHIGVLPSREQLCQWVTERQIEAHRIDMPSFLAFRDRLAEVL